MTILLDTNVLVRHVTADPPALASRATEFLREQDGLLLADVIVAEVVFVLESYYKAPREDVAHALRSLLALDSVVCPGRSVALRAVDVYLADRLDFAEAYLVAFAEHAGVTQIASFDRSIDRVPSVTRIEPGADS